MPNTALPVETIPTCLRDRPQWVCWKYTQRSGKQTKVPINARYGWNASATDPQTWSTFQAAHEAYLKNDKLAGVGFVFTKDDPYAGVDMDRCLDDDGNFVWGREIVEQLTTYTEVSPSGHGVKLFLQASKPPFAKCRRDGFGPAGDGEIEVYDHGRFFAVTGRTVAATTHGNYKRCARRCGRKLANLWRCLKRHQVMALPTAWVPCWPCGSPIITTARTGCSQRVAVAWSMACRTPKPSTAFGSTNASSHSRQPGQTTTSWRGYATSNAIVCAVLR